MADVSLLLCATKCVRQRHVAKMPGENSGQLLQRVDVSWQSEQRTVQMPNQLPEVTDAVSESAKASLVPSTASPHKSAAPAEEKVQAIDIVDAVYLSEPDADSAGDMGELARFEHMSESFPSSQSSVVSVQDAMICLPVSVSASCRLGVQQ